MLDDAHSHDMSETLPEAGVRDTLARLIQQSGEGFASLSRLIGRNPAYIQQYLKRGIPRRLSEQDRRRLARHFGVSEALFGAPVATLSPHAAAPDLISIPWLMPGGGDTALQLPPSLLGALPAARRTWLAALKVEGDGMAPTLLPGDHVLIDTADLGPLRDGLYAIAGSAEPVLKRLSVNPLSGQVALLADNAAYPSFADCDPAQVRPLGRVVWVCRALV
jgi:hypothetical protein